MVVNGCSKTFSGTRFSLAQYQGSIGQLRQVTCTGYMRSAPNPRAQKRRVAATSA